jgi:hypothetical protein
MKISRYWTEYPWKNISHGWPTDPALYVDGWREAFEWTGTLGEQ